MISQKAANIIPYKAGEQPRGKAYIKLNTNENPYPPSDKVISALKNADFSRLRLYPDPESTILREAAAKEFGLDKENIFCGNGSDEILAFCFQAFYDDVNAQRTMHNAQLKHVHFPDVTYSFYPVWCGLYGIPYKTVPVNNACHGDTVPDSACRETCPPDPAAVRSAPADRNFQFSINPADYLNLKNSQGVVLANPNAPTGRALAVKDIERIVAANPNDAVIIDEAYVDFGGETAAPLIKKYENLCVVRTFSKGYSLAGLRAGFAMASETLIGALKKMRDCFNSYPLDMLAQTAAAAALADKAYFAAQNAKVIKTRERFINRLEKAGFFVVPSSANFIFASHKNIGAETLYTKLKEAGVLVRWFNKPGIDNWLRISIGTDDEMNECVVRMKDVF